MQKFFVDLTETLLSNNERTTTKSSNFLTPTSLEEHPTLNTFNWWSVIPLFNYKRLSLILYSSIVITIHNKSLSLEKFSG